MNPIVRARDGLEALEILRGNENTPSLPKPFIILLDINMPRMNGLEFLHELRKDRDLKQTIVFVLTTSNNAQDRYNAYQFNVAGYILKQRAGEDFMNAVRLIDDYQTVVVLPDLVSDVTQSQRKR